MNQDFIQGFIIGVLSALGGCAILALTYAVYFKRIVYPRLQKKHKEENKQPGKHMESL